jgi:hypothetical protein
VINPGFVYTHGLSAYLHYGVAGSMGILCAFLVLTRGFLRLGERSAALIQVRLGDLGNRRVVLYLIMQR